MLEKGGCDIMPLPAPFELFVASADADQYVEKRDRAPASRDWRQCGLARGQPQKRVPGFGVLRTPKPGQCCYTLIIRYQWGGCGWEFWKQATSYCATLLGFLEFCGCVPA